VQWLSHMKESCFLLLDVGIPMALMRYGHDGLVGY